MTETSFRSLLVDWQQSAVYQVVDKTPPQYVLATCMCYMSLEYRKGGCFSRVHRLKPVKSWHRAFLHVSRARHGKTIWTHAMTRKSANSTFPLYDMEFMQQKPGAAAAALLSCLLPFRAYFLRGSRPKGRWENKNPSPLQHSFISRIILPPHKSKTLSRQVGNGSVCNWDSPRPERFAQGTLKKAKCDFLQELTMTQLYLCEEPYWSKYDQAELCSQEPQITVISDGQF